jgi:hypothetical protein
MQARTVGRPDSHKRDVFMSPSVRHETTSEALVHANGRHDDDEVTRAAQVDVAAYKAENSIMRRSLGRSSASGFGQTNSDITGGGAVRPVTQIELGQSEAVTGFARRRDGHNGSVSAMQMRPSAPRPPTAVRYAQTYGYSRA